jgi:N-acetylglutamate synthase-like GNAT family acetyltransferase
MNDIQISSDKNRLDIDYIHRFLRQSYWAAGIPKDLVEMSIENAYCFGVYKNSNQVGFARAVTDFTTFAYLADVFIDPEEQGKGYGKRLVYEILNDERLKNIRRWHLITKDAQDFYTEMSFSPLTGPEKHMEKYRKPEYRKV